MLGHIGVYVENLKESHEFYQPVLKAIGLDVIFEYPQCIAYGSVGDPYFEIYTGKAKSSPIHVAFRVRNRQQVEEFHQVGLNLKGTDNGKPGIRKWDALEYYAAFIIDPNGHNLEAFC